MNTKDIVDIIHSLESNEDTMAHYFALEKLGKYSDSDNDIYNRATGQLFDNQTIARNCYAKEEIDLINSWVAELGEDNFDSSPFAERTFLRNFLASVPPEEQMLYIRNTNMYYGKNRELADENYVLVTRRSLPSKEDKPEAFWSSEPTTTYWGLKNESRGAQRGYSTILVSTLRNIIDHGEKDFETPTSGASDGEIIISIKNFPRDKILFAFKPLDEVMSLIKTIESAEKSYDEFLEDIKKIAAEAYKQQQSSQNKTPEDSYSDSEDMEFGDDWD